MGQIKNCEAPGCFALQVQIDNLMGSAVAHVALVIYYTSADIKVNMVIAHSNHCVLKRTLVVDL